MVNSFNNIKSDQSAVYIFKFDRKTPMLCVIIIKANLSETCIYIRMVVWKILKSSKTGKKNLNGRRFRIRNNAIQNGKKIKNRNLHMSHDMQVWM